MTTRDIVAKYFEHVNSGDWDAWLDLFDEHIVMDEQLAGHTEGKQQLEISIEGLRGNKDFHNYPKVFVVEGDQAMVQWHIVTKGPKGENIECDGVNYYRIENGKIKYFANFHDSDPFRPIFESTK